MGYVEGKWTGNILLIVPFLGSSQLLRGGGLHLIGRGREVGFAVEVDRKG